MELPFSTEKRCDRVYREGSVVTCNSNDAENAVLCHPEALESHEYATITGVKRHAELPCTPSHQVLSSACVLDLYARAVHRNVIHMPFADTGLSSHSLHPRIDVGQAFCPCTLSSPSIFFAISSRKAFVCSSERPPGFPTATCSWVCNSLLQSSSCELVEVGRFDFSLVSGGGLDE